MDVIELRRRLLMQEVVKGMRLVRKYIVPESWENDTKGNALAIYNLLMKDIVEANATYNGVIAIFENNNASNVQYKADYIVVNGNSSGIVSQGTCSVRYNFTNISGSITSGRSLWASIGTIINVYALH